MSEARGSEREKQLTRNDYLTKEYFSYNQLWSFSEQIYHIMGTKPESVLEIGIGNGFVSTFLKQIGILVTTVDINENLNPDVILPVEEISKRFTKSSFNLISCCEVLEHIPFESFEQIIKDFSIVSRKLFLTLPMHNRSYGIGGFIQMPKFDTWIGAWLSLPKNKELPPPHYWEINHSRQTKNKIIVSILKKYYSDVESSLFKMHPAHRYYKCTNKF